MGITEKAPSSTRRRNTVIMIALLLFTVVVATGRVMFRMMYQDEFLSFHTDSQPTALDVVKVQLTSPISLDPLSYHLLAHAAMSVLGRNALAERLPSIVGFLLTVLCVYLFLRRIVPERVAVVGALFLLATTSFTPVLVGRPYGLLLGLSAISLLCWQSLARETDKRLIFLIGLGLSLALAVNAHYFAFLMLLPLTAGEAVRIFHRRRIDWEVLFSIAFGYLSIAALLPFRKALIIYQKLYWTVDPVLLRSIPRNYTALIADWEPRPFHYVLGTLLLLGLIVASVRVSMTLVGRDRMMSRAELTALMVFASIPALGTALGTFVTHTFQPRYVLEGLLGVDLLFVLAAEKWLRLPRLSYAAQYLLIVYTAVTGAWQGYDNYRLKRHLEASLIPDAAASARFALDPSAPIYVQDSDLFYRGSYYLLDDAIRHRLRLLYGFNQEVRLRRMDTFSIMAHYTAQISPLRAVQFASFCNGEPHLLLTTGARWEWIRDELKTDSSEVRLIGRYMDADLEEVVCRNP